MSPGFPSKNVQVYRCTHAKRAHRQMKGSPAGACAACECPAFEPEPTCRCGHGLKAHAKGPCKQAYLDNCRAFRASEK